MKKRLFSIIILLAVILVACQGNDVSQPANPDSSGNPWAPISGTNTPAPTEVAPQGCTVISPDPTPGPTEESLFPPITDDDWTIGPDDSLVTILEYGDYECPGCSGLSPVLEQIQKKYPQDVRIVYRHFPLIGIHQKAAITTQAAEAAGLQGKFWDMHSFIYAHQDTWSEMTVEEFQDWIVGEAEAMGLDKEQFEKDMLSEEIKAIPQDAWDEGYNRGMLGTPFIIINGEIFNNTLPLTEGNLLAIVNLHLLEKRQFTSCPPMSIDPEKDYTATLHTEKGDILIQLFSKQAPIAVNNFIFLARNGWYDNVIFHRVTPGYGAQAGDPSGTGYGTPGYAFVNEISSSLTFNKEGMVAMANAGPDSNGSQFFITFAPAPDLNGKYTIFGQVISGMSIAVSLEPRDPMDGLSLPGEKILSITIEEK